MSVGGTLLDLARATAGQFDQARRRPICKYRVVSRGEIAVQRELRQRIKRALKEVLRKPAPTSI
jgi:hypothetical protein